MTPLSTNKNYCKNHPESETTWRCTECDSEFCDNCVKPVESYFTKTAICPECKGRCEDFKAEAEKASQKEKEEFVKERNTTLAYSLFSLFAMAFLFSPNDLTFLFLIIASFWFGPLKKMALVYKLGAILFFSWMNNPLFSSLSTLASMMMFKDIPGVFAVYKKYFIQSAIISAAFYMNEKISNWVSTIYYSKRQITPEKFGVHRWIISSLSLMVIALIIIFGVVKLIQEPKEDEVTQIKKLTLEALTYRIAEEISHEEIDFEKISMLENSIDEKANMLLKGNRTDRFNSLLEPYGNMTIDEIWTYYKTGQEKIEKSMEQKFGQYHGARVNEAIQKLFYRELGSYRTVQEVIEKGTPFSKYYLYVHLKYVPMPES
jgi:hypothetical protein